MSSLLISFDRDLFLIDKFGNYVCVEEETQLSNLINQFQSDLRMLYLGKDESTLHFLRELIIRRPEISKLILPVQGEVVVFKKDL